MLVKGKLRNEETAKGRSLKTVEQITNHGKPALGEVSGTLVRCWGVRPLESSRGGLFLYGPLLEKLNRSKAALKTVRPAEGHGY